MTIGFQNFRNFMEIKIQQLFADALAPMLTRLKNMQEEHEKKLEVIRQEMETINEVQHRSFKRYIYMYYILLILHNIIYVLHMCYMLYIIHVLYILFISPYESRSLGV